MPEPPPASFTPVPRGRGSTLSPDSRYAAWTRIHDAEEALAAHGIAGADCDDGEDGCNPATVLEIDRARSVLSYNHSPDIPFDRSINPYRGCEHGCSYCFARPTHAYLGLSPGLDFETRLSWKPDAARLLRAELARPGYRCAPIALGVNTDAYQPVERRLGITRQILEVLAATRHPVHVITKSALIERDVDLLADLARDGLAQVMFSVTTLDDELARRMEPRAARPARRLAAMARLARAGIPVGVLCAPLIPALNDHELESVLEAAQAHGARTAGYVLLRLPHELRELFADWLVRHYPGRARHVLSLIAQTRGGRLNDARFGHRMRGQGVFADLYRQRLQRACARLGLHARAMPVFDTTRFRPPAADARQLRLFDE
ncbi:PA0069 family radical SAM protein [Pseudothauera nasutitermitis]|nr:PA0069 family radical SAM protein [Pseudothauera nasutitermitis]